jgi:hypothetical protein
LSNDQQKRGGFFAMKVPPFFIALHIDDPGLRWSAADAGGNID